MWPNMQFPAITKYKLQFHDEMNVISTLKLLKKEESTKRYTRVKFFQETQNEMNFYKHNHLTV